MTRSAIIAFVCICFCVLSSAGEGLAKRITTDEVERMRAKVEARLNAYHRFDLAEREALEEGAKDRAASFREAKQKAYQDYIEENAKFQKFQMEKREQDKRMEAQAAQPPR